MGRGIAVSGVAIVRRVFNLPRSYLRCRAFDEQNDDFLSLRPVIAVPTRVYAMKSDFRLLL